MESGVIPVGMETKRRVVAFFEKTTRAQEGDPLRRQSEKKVEKRAKALA